MAVKSNSPDVHGMLSQLMWRTVLCLSRLSGRFAGSEAIWFVVLSVAVCRPLSRVFAGRALTGVGLSHPTCSAGHKRSYYILRSMYRRRPLALLAVS